MREHLVTREDCRQRLLTVSNRGPVEHHFDETGAAVAVPGQGGLANALRAAAQYRPTTWLSSPMTPVDRLIAEGKCPPAANDGASHFVATDARAYDLFYSTFSNEVLWFLQHSLPIPDELGPREIREAWEAGYLAVNRAFAGAVIDELAAGSFRAVMIHDYHFYALPRKVRDARRDAYLQHFIHIPWPAASTWKALSPDIAQAVCDGLLANDSVVFQTGADAAAFLDTVESLLPGVAVDHESGRVSYRDHETRVWANGISADPRELDEAAASPEFSRYRYLLRPDPGQKLIVRVDRLDLTKNHVRGFEAYRLLLRQHPELREKVLFLALLVPSKTDIPSYREYQDQTLRLVEEINSEFGNHRWKPIRVINEHNRMQALAAMSLYDVLLVNPVADGMNLIAKEGPVLNTRDGVLVLSTRAGAWDDLAEGAVGIDPEDVEATADALYAGLTMPPHRRRERALRLRSTIREHDLRDWFQRLIDDIDRNARVRVGSAA